MALVYSYLITPQDKSHPSIADFIYEVKVISFDPLDFQNLSEQHIASCNIRCLAVKHIGALERGGDMTIIVATRPKASAAAHLAIRLQQAGESVIVLRNSAYIDDISGFPELCNVCVLYGDCVRSTLCNLITIISRLITHTGLVCADVADFEMIVDTPGHAYLRRLADLPSDAGKALYLSVGTAYPFSMANLRRIFQDVTRVTRLRPGAISACQHYFVDHLAVDECDIWALLVYDCPQTRG